MAKELAKSSADALRQVRLISDNAIRYDGNKYVPGLDRFGLQTRLQPLIDSIRNPDLNTPYSIMITGGWGTGKTSAMRWLSNYLGSGQDKSTKECEVDVCWFYPWKYQNEEDVWKGLIAEVIVSSMTCQDVTAEKVITAARQVGKFLGGSFVRLLSGLSLKIGDGKTTGEASYSFKDSLTGIIEEYGKHVTPQDAYYNQFEQVLKDWIGGVYGPKRRMVVFIDDLDRCLPEVALKVLEAIKLYLNIEHLVFVAGVDKTVINAVVAKRYEDMVGADRSKESIMVDKARQYLDKMFQVEVTIPPHDRQVREFLDDQLKGCGLLEVIMEEYRGIVRDAILEVGSNNPRSVIRALNAAIMGIQQDNTNELTRTQRVQHELIKSICAGLPGNRFPRCHEMLTTKADRDFFRRWYESTEKLGSRYLTERDLKARQESDLEITSERSDSIMNKSALFDLYNDEDFVEYRSYLTVAPIGILMKIPYTSLVEDPSGDQSNLRLGNSDFGWLKEILASERGVAKSEIADNDVQSLTRLNLTNSNITDTFCASIRELTNLTELVLTDNNVTDAGCGYLRELTNLTDLDLRSNQITESGCVYIKDMSGLTKLLLSGNHISDSGCQYLKDLTKLKHLYLRSTNISSISCVYLKNLTDLVQLYMNGNKISDEGCAHLKELINLNGLFLGVNEITDKGCTYLKELTSLTTLDLRSNQITDEGCISLKELTNLTELILRSNLITNDGCEYLKELTNLTELDLSSNLITDSGCASLKELTNLIRLELSGNEISDQALSFLRTNLPNTEILH